MRKVELETAVRENRMVTKEEGTVRKAVGAVLLLVSLWNLWSKGVANVSPGSTAFWFALSSTVMATGLRHQCGCAVRLKWAVDSSSMQRIPAPPPYQPFMRAKRRGFLANVFGSAVGAVVVTVALHYFAAGQHGPRVLRSAAKGAIVETAAMLVMAYTA